MAKTNSGKKPVTQEEYITNKVLAVFSVCLLGVLVLMVLQRLMDYAATWDTGVLAYRVLLGVGVAGVLWSLWLLARERAGKRTVERRIVCGRNVLIVSIITVLMMTAIGQIGIWSLKWLYVVLPALAVYYLVYHSYATEFFLIAVDCGVAAALIFIVRRGLLSANFGMVIYAAAAAAVVLALVQLLWVRVLRKNNGRFRLAGRERALRLSRNAYVMLTVTPIVMAVTLLVATFLPAVSVFCVGIVAAYLFVTAVYYTVKLM